MASTIHANARTTPVFDGRSGWLPSVSNAASARQHRGHLAPPYRLCTTLAEAREQQASHRSRKRFWDIPVPKIDPIFDCHYGLGRPASVAFRFAHTGQIVSPRGYRRLPTFASLPLPGPVLHRSESPAQAGTHCEALLCGLVRPPAPHMVACRLCCSSVPQDRFQQGTPPSSITPNTRFGHSPVFNYHQDLTYEITSHHNHHWSFGICRRLPDGLLP